MDFSFNDEQQELRGLARRILEDKVTEPVLRAADAADARFDEPTWKALAEAGLLGIGLPDDLGGSGLGIVEQCVVLEEVGRTVAPVPVAASTVLGALPIAQFGSEELRQRWVTPAATGELVLTAAWAEPANRYPERPVTTAAAVAGGWQLDGVKTCVQAGTQAAALLVPATTPDGVALFVVDRDAAGLRIEAQRTTDRNAYARATLDGVVVDSGAVVGSVAEGAGVVRWALERATLAQCAQMLGVLSRALEMTAGYATQRVQFDRPIATFQAVGHRLADCYIAIEGLRLTTLQAMWALEAGHDAAMEVEVAKFWAAEAGHHVAHAVVHVHGGTGIDEDYPLHRYFVAAKALEFALGGATDQLLRIGAAFATTRD